MSTQHQVNSPDRPELRSPADLSERSVLIGASSRSKDTGLPRPGPAMSDWPQLARELARINEELQALAAHPPHGRPDGATKEALLSAAAGIGRHNGVLKKLSGRTTRAAPEVKAGSPSGGDASGSGATAPAEGGSISVRVDEQLAADLEVLAQAGWTITGAVRHAITLLADVHASAWEHQAAPPNSPITITSATIAPCHQTPAEPPTGQAPAPGQTPGTRQPPQAKETPDPRK